MATGIAQHMLDRYVFPRFARLHILIKLFSVRRLMRKTLLFLEPKRGSSRGYVDLVPSNTLEKYSAHFHEHGWVFIEEVFTNSSHKCLVEDWPAYYHFNPIKDIYKSYDSQFIDTKKTISQYPMIGTAVEYLQSKEFTTWLSGLYNGLSNDNLIAKPVKKVVFTRAYYQSSVVTHLDGVSKGSDVPWLNCLFFVLGTGGPQAGGTCIMSDKNGDPIFEATNLTNSCLIYRSDNIYHGFPPMKFGTYRWMFSGQVELMRSIDSS